MEMTLQHWALLALTVVVIIGSLLVYLAVRKGLDKGVVKNLYPDQSLMRLNFAILLVVATVFLGLGLGKDLPQYVVGLIGTIAGFLLGGIPSSRHGSNDTGDRNRAETAGEERDTNAAVLSNIT